MSCSLVSHRRPGRPLPIHRVHPELEALLLASDLPPRHADEPVESWRKRLTEPELASAAHKAIERARASRPDLAAHIMTSVEAACRRFKDREITFASFGGTRQRAAAWGDPWSKGYLNPSERAVLLDPAHDALWLPTEWNYGGQLPGHLDPRCLRCFGEGEGEYQVADCGHMWCRECVVDYLRHRYGESRREGAYLRPECCFVPFHPDLYWVCHLSVFMQLFWQLEREMERQPQDRIYCHSSRYCSEYICERRARPEPKAGDGNNNSSSSNGHGASVSGDTPCPACNRLTCAFCGLKGHGSSPCEQVTDEERERYWDDLDASKIIGCASCGRLIERAVGCSHMACPCGTSFCEICGKIKDPDAEQWPCRCPLYEGTPMLIRAREGVRPSIRLTSVRAPPEEPNGDLGIPQLRPDLPYFTPKGKVIHISDDFAAEVEQADATPSDAEDQGESKG